MSPTAESNAFVLLRLSERRFALAASLIAELVPPGRIFRFPHRTKEVEGVILRRGRMVPVCDIAERLGQPSLRLRRFYLIAQRRYTEQAEWVALPVTGECELIHADVTPAVEGDSPHVGGWLSHGGEVIEVLNLAALTPGPGQIVEQPADGPVSVATETHHAQEAQS
jgi:chemotaxis signal transduction protein